MFTIARATFIEFLRDRILGSFLVLGLVLLICTGLVDQLTIGAERGRILLDMGLASITALVLLLVFFIGSSLLVREFQERTITIIFSKPLPRSHFLLGKFFGIAALLLVLLIGFGFLFWLTMLLKGVPLTLAVLQTFVTLYMESLFILSMLFFFSSLLSPLLTISVSVALFLAGSLMPFLQEYLTRQPESGLQYVQWLYYLVPNFGIFHIGDVASLGYLIAWPQWGAMLLYGVLYTALFLTLTVYFIRHREL